MWRSDATTLVKCKARCRSAQVIQVNRSDLVLMLVMVPRTHFISVSLTVGYMGQG